MTRPRAALAAFVGAVTVVAAEAAIAADPVVPIAPAPQVVKTSILAGSGSSALGLAAFQNSLLPGTANTRSR